MNISYIKWIITLNSKRWYVMTNHMSTSAQCIVSLNVMTSYNQLHLYTWSDIWTFFTGCLCYVTIAISIQRYRYTIERERFVYKANAETHLHHMIIFFRSQIRHFHANVVTMLTVRAMSTALGRGLMLCTVYLSDTDIVLKELKSGTRSLGT